MNKDFAKTFQYLALTDNETALDVLISGLDSPYKSTRESSLLALLRCRSTIGHRAAFRRLSTLDAQTRLAIQEQPDGLVGVITEILRETDAKLHQAAYETAMTFHLYDAIPTLVSKLIDPSNPDPSQTAKTVSNLTDAFYREIAGEVATVKSRDFDRLRTKITTSLEEAVRKYHRHRQEEAIEAFLLLAKRKNPVLHCMLTHSEEAAHEPMLEVLAQSTRGGVKRLLLGFLSAPQMPSAMIRTIGGRCDAEFVNLMLRMMESPSKDFLETLGNFKTFAWAEPGCELFEKLDDKAQAAAVSLLMRSGVDRKKVGEVIEFLFFHGKAGGRRAAAEALAQFDGETVDATVVAGLQDSDPDVLAALLVQLRPRNISGALGLLLGKIDHPHPSVQEALRKALPEFCTRYFLRQFISLSEELRISTGYLARKLDPDSVSLLSAEMQVQSPVRRRVAILAAGTMGLVPDLEPQIINLLSDDDHMVRIVAASALADCKSVPSWEALHDASLDRCFLVNEAAMQSIELIRQSLSAESLT